jgi:ubiquinone/menaquinone biosynthesis C-methylase UbiE
LLSLQKTFEVERGFLKGRMQPDFVVLDVGCGAARPTTDLAPFVKKIVAIDNDARVLKVAKSKCKKFSNIELHRMNALDMRFPSNLFDVSYSTYNLIGSVEREDISRLVSEMVRVTKKGGQVISITWKNDPAVTHFLSKYYPSIGLSIIELDETKTVTDKGTFDRLSREDLRRYYKKAGLKKIKFFEIEPVWRAIVGTK